MKNNKKNGEWIQFDYKGIPLRKSFYDMGKLIDDELVVVNGDSDNPMEDLKNYTKKAGEVRIQKQRNLKVF